MQEQGARASYPEKSEAIIQKLTRELNPNKDQQSQLNKILNKQWDQVEKSGNEGREVNWQLINQKTRDDFEKILTVEQHDQFLKLKEEQRKDKEAYLFQNPGYVFSEEDKELVF